MPCPHSPAPSLSASAPTRDRKCAGRARSGVQECRSAGMQRAQMQMCRVQGCSMRECRSVRVQGCRMQGCRDAGCRSAGVQVCRGAEVQGCRGIGLQGAGVHTPGPHFHAWALPFAMLGCISQNHRLAKDWSISLGMCQLLIHSW